MDVFNASEEVSSVMRRDRRVRNVSAAWIPAATLPQALGCGRNPPSRVTTPQSTQKWYLAQDHQQEPTVESESICYPYPPSSQLDP
ncbi:hypothetical protein N7528_010256 [Penicillium herquei]|nr:hypothetical protein N7528_010256 [Penicillium herquei]